MGQKGNLADFKVSPNAVSIAYTFSVELSQPVDDNVYCRSCAELYVMKTDGTGHTIITDKNLYYGTEQPYEWSPDSARLAFLEFWDPNLESNLKTVLSGGGGQVIVVKGEELTRLTGYQWTPDSNAIVYLIEYPRREWGEPAPNNLFSIIADQNSLKKLLQICFRTIKNT